MVLPDTDHLAARQVAERVRRKVAGLELEHAGVRVPVTLTAGVAEYRPGSSLDTCFRAADRALYQGKAEGRNRVVEADARGFA